MLENKEQFEADSQITEAPHIIRLKEHCDTFHLSAKRKRYLLDLLTRGGRNERMTNTILDITDVPVSRDAFNLWFLSLIKTTDLVIVDYSCDVEVESGFRNVKQLDGTFKEVYFSEVPYPYDIDFSTGDYDEDLMPVKVEWVKKGKPIVTGIGQFEVAKEDQMLQFRIRKIEVPVKDRSDILNAVMHKRELAKEIDSLSDYCEIIDGQKVFTINSVNNVTERFNELLEHGQSIRPLFGIGDMPETAESAYNLAKLFVAANEQIEMDPHSSGKTFCMKLIYPFVSQFTYDYSSYKAFCEDFIERHPIGSHFLMCKVRGIFETVQVQNIHIKENDTGMSKYSVSLSYMEFGHTYVEENEIDLRFFYAMNRIALPLGYNNATTEGLLPFEERTKYFSRSLSEMREFSEHINYDGISQFIGSNMHYDANTDYIQVFKVRLQAEYDELGLGPIPEIDLKEIISGAESPYSHNAREQLNKKLKQKAKFKY